MDQSFQQPPLPLQARPKNWLVESILVTIFCCLPLGIVGIVFAAQVNSKFDAGDYTGAIEASRNAGKFTKLGFWISIAGFILYILIVFLFFGGTFFWASSHNNY